MRVLATLLFGAAAVLTGYAIWAVTSEDLQGGRAGLGVVAFLIAACLGIVAARVFATARRR
jgi:hypothetical protein